MPGLTGEIANLIVALKLDDSGFSGKLNSAARKLKGLDAGFSQIGKGAGQVGQGIGKIADRVALAGAAAGTFLVTTAASFEQAEAGIRKTVGGTTEEVDDLIDSIKQMSRTVPVSFEELAAIAAEGGALGIANDQLAAFTDIVARLGVSTDLTTDQASSALGQLANVLHLQDEELRDFGDSLVALGNDGASTESQILDMTARFGAAGKQAGLSNEAILALASTTASMGIEAEAGGGALSRVFNGITVDIATANDESKALADAMGLSLGELRTAWDDDAGAVFGDLLGYINKLDQFDAAKFLQDLGITNTRDINAIMLLASGVDEYQRQLGVAEGQTDELNRESDAFFNTTQGKWETLKNNVRLAADQIGGKLLPVVNELADDFITWLSDPKVQKGIEEFGTGLAEKVRGLIEDIKGADFGPLIDALKGAAGIAKAGFDAFNALPSGVKALALAAFGINKVTGGALGDIAKGFGNITLGGLKILFERGSPTNPMWVKSVDGPLGGGPGGGGKGGGQGGLLRGLFGATVVAGIELAIAEWAAQNVTRPLNPTGFDFNTVAGQSGRFGSQIQVERFITALSTEVGMPINETKAAIVSAVNTQGLTFDQAVERLRASTKTSVDDTRDAVDRNREVNARIREELARSSTNASSIANRWGSEARAAYARLTNSATSTGQKSQRLIDLAQTAQSFNARIATASEITSRKNFSPTIINDVKIPVTVGVNASVVLNQTYRYRTTTNGLPVGNTVL